MHPVFLCGPWANAQFCAQLAGGQVSGVAALLAGHTQRLAAHTLVPLIVAQAHAQSEGIVLSLDADALKRLSCVQSVFGAEPVHCTALVDGADVQVTAFVSVQPVQGPDWQPSDWGRNRTAVVSGALGELAGLPKSHPSAALRARWPMALSHAASVLRGASDPSPSTLRRDGGLDDVALEHRSQPYAWYFGLREDDLRFRRFDGTMSPMVKRAALLMSDAVTVLPYDPLRDRVLVIEQFRYGPWLRGVPNPWSLEPIAGRVDPFETPQDAALREAQEESRLVLRADRLELVGNVYPSPGAVTEFMYQFVALCDLPDGAGGVAGLETEAEDIRSHVISYEQLMTLVTTGEVQNGPLALTAWWLTAHRARLRDAAQAEQR